ncbi:MAG: hypothetical protein K6T80_03345 [Firmicutes bacterium]|nr:hypothetical protein [Bacillota bacterium]
MENARLLDERLRRIISEVGDRTGAEIKKSLLNGYEAGVASAVGRQARQETVRILQLLKEAVNRL